MTNTSDEEVTYPSRHDVIIIFVRIIIAGIFGVVIPPIEVVIEGGSIIILGL